jgi:hypothetical protein
MTFNKRAAIAHLGLIWARIYLTRPPKRINIMSGGGGNDGPSLLGSEIRGSAL